MSKLCSEKCEKNCGRIREIETKQSHKSLKAICLPFRPRVASFYCEKEGVEYITEISLI